MKLAHSVDMVAAICGRKIAAVPDTRALDDQSFMSAEDPDGVHYEYLLVGLICWPLPSIGGTNKHLAATRAAAEANLRELLGDVPLKNPRWLPRWY